MNMRQVNDTTVNLIKSFEGLRLQAYTDSVGIWTIGYGTIQYPNGVKVKKGDSITEVEALEHLTYEVNKKAYTVEKLLRTEVNDNQFGALTSFSYNVGSAALSGSTLLRKVNANPNDPTITQAFLSWSKARVNGVLTPLAGLIRRRQAEADLYFT